MSDLDVDEAEMPENDDRAMPEPSDVDLSATRPPGLPHQAEAIYWWRIVRELVNAHDALAKAIEDDTADHGAEATPEGLLGAVSLNAAGRRMNEAWAAARAALEA